MANNLSYFELRNIEPDFYRNFLLPYWLKDELLKIKNMEIKILDFGCGYGHFLKALKKEGYQSVYGVDIDNQAINHCLDIGLEVIKIDPNNLINPYSFKFDVIVMFHVIEHIEKSKIIDTLKIIKTNFLTHGGVLFVTVPNAQSNTGAYWAYEDWTHTTIFTSGSLYYVLRSAGFNSVEFLDIDCTAGSTFFKRILKKTLLKIYVLKKSFWNKVTSSSFHKPSPQIFSYEIKAKAY